MKKGENKRKFGERKVEKGKNERIRLRGTFLRRNQTFPTMSRSPLWYGDFCTASHQQGKEKREKEERRKKKEERR